MPENSPLLVLPKPVPVNRSNLPPGYPQIQYPNYSRQKVRLKNTFANLKAMFAQHRIQFASTIAGAEPEKVLVFETVGSFQDFYKAAAAIPELDWQVEMDGQSVEPDEDFFDGSDKESDLPKKMYAVFSNYKGMKRIISLWNKYKRDGGSQVPRGQKKWNQLFNQLHDVRFWEAKDRIESTGLLAEVQQYAQQNLDNVRVEIELWFREPEEKRSIAEAKVRSSIEELDGKVLSAFSLPEIRYHAILAEMSLAAAQGLSVLDNSIDLVKADDIMFFRPVAQAIFSDEPAPQQLPTENVVGPIEREQPIVAVLDGLPLENHDWIRNHLRLDDPEGLSATVPAAERVHGTGILSAVVHGDRSGPVSTIKSPVYVRPVLKASVAAGQVIEELPYERLSVDVIHSAVVRMLEGAAALAKTVKIINVSIGDKFRPFDSAISPLGRLIDWLSDKYNVLFVVSAGNHPTDFEFDMPSTALESSPVETRQSLALAHLVKTQPFRKILSPAESINAVAIGACNSDHSGAGPDPSRIEIVSDANAFAPYSAFGLGFNRTIKPDFLAPGGRPFYRIHSTAPAKCTYAFARAPGRPPGIKVASPGAPGTQNSFVYVHGTSYSAALSTNVGCRVIESLLDNPNIELDLNNEYLALLAKTLLGHGVAWVDGKAILDAAAMTSESRTWLPRFIGYGVLNPQRAMFCDDYVATAIGMGALKKEEAHEYEIPLPPSFSGANVHKRVTVTLGWFTPVDFKSPRYRKASLWFDAPRGTTTGDPLRVGRKHIEYRMVRRGTLQHEVFEGSDIVTFPADEGLKIQVNCRVDASNLREATRYALAVSIEAVDRSIVNVYQEVQQRIAQVIGVNV